MSAGSRRSGGESWLARLGRHAAGRGVAWLVRRRFPDVRTLSPRRLAARLSPSEAWSAAEPPLLLDVRTAAEFAVSHLAGARRLDPDQPDLTALGSAERARAIVVYCSVGYRSARVAKVLERAGFSQVLNLEGGIFRWANEGRPLVDAAGAATRVHPFDARWGRLLEPASRGDLPRESRTIVGDR